MGNKQSPQKHPKQTHGRYDYNDYKDGVSHQGPHVANGQQRNGYLATYNAPAPVADEHAVRHGGLELVSGY